MKISIEIICSESQTKKSNTTETEIAESTDEQVSKKNLKLK